MAIRNLGQSSRNQAQMVHAGTNTVIFHISASTSISTADVYNIGRIPHGAIPVGCVFFPAAQIAAKFGTSASLSLFLASATYSVANTALGGAIYTTKRLGYAFQVSVSDDAAVRYDNVTMSGLANGASLGFIGDLVVTYIMPGQAP
jgi:hypothetical protein